ncbi:MAG: alpha/beta hydrolase [Candidatus Binatia bacterium]
MNLASELKRLVPNPAHAPLGRGVIDGAIHGVTAAARLARTPRRRWLGVDVTANVAYRDTGMKEHQLDVYRSRSTPVPAPALVYVHGGAFLLCSKETHWSIAEDFAERGFVVFNINYRLAPRHRYPAAVEDVCAALLWVRDNGERFGADTSQIVIAGESAGGNLASAAAVATAYDLGTPEGRDLFESGLSLKAVIASCGVLQVTDTARFWRRKPHTPHWVRDQLSALEELYLPRRGVRPGELPLADPLVVVEERTPDRELPPIFAFAGTRDPLLHDSKRMKAALEDRGVECKYRVYPNELHAFHALPWRAAARRCWKDQMSFLSRYVKF